jgi:WD40 repeat protein
MRKFIVLACAVLALCLLWGCASRRNEQLAINNEQLEDGDERVTGSGEQLAISSEQNQGDFGGEAGKLRVDGLEVEVFPQLGHNSFIYSVAFSPNGKQIVSSSIDNTIKLWDTETGKEIRTFSGHSSGVRSVMFSPDGKTIVSGSADKTIKIWDVETGKDIKTFLGHSSGVNSVVFSPNGRKVLSGSSDYSLKLWDVETGLEEITFIGHTSYIWSVMFSPDGKQALSVSFDDTIRLWNIKTGQEVRTYSGQKYRESAVFSPNGKYILSNFDSETLMLLDVETGLEIKKIDISSRHFVSSIMFSSDGKQILSGSSNYTHNIKLWDAETGEEIRTYFGHKRPVNSVVFSPNGKQILSCSEDGTIKLWDIESGQEIRTFSGYTNSYGLIFFNHNENFVFSGSEDGSIILWDTEEGKVIRIYSRQNEFIISVNPDRKQIFSTFGHFNELLKLWDAETGSELKTFSGHNSAVGFAVFSSDGKQILSCSQDFTLKLWDVETGNEIRTFSGHTSYITDIAFSPDCKQILSGSWDGSVRLWDVDNGQEIWTFRGEDINTVTSIAFSPDGKYILAGTTDFYYHSKEKIIKLWNAETGNELQTFYGHGDGVVSVTFSPDGKYILSGSNDNTIKLWEIETGRIIKTFTGHFGRVCSVIINNSGNRIISASTDGTVRLWDIATGKEIASFISFTDGEWIVITLDGYYNASPKGDQYLNVRIGNNVYGMDQFAKTFYQPEVVQRRLQGLPDPDYIKPGVSIQTASIPPDLKVKAGEVDPVTRHVTLTVTASDWIRQINDVEIIINGRLLGADELKTVSAVNLQAAHTRLVAASAEKQYEFSINLQLDPGLNHIEIVAANDANYGLAPVIISVPYSPPQNGVEQKGDLWVLAIGVDKYAENPAYQDLEFAVSDSKRIIASFKAQEGKRFNKVHTLCIADNEAVTPTRQNILANLEFLKRAKPNDLAVLYVAAHGKTEDGVYYFFPSDTVFTADGNFDTKSVINITDLTKALDIPGRKIVMLDTCESGGVDNNRLIHNLRNRSTVIFTASQEDQNAGENSLLYGGGIFTYAVTNGLKGEAAEKGTVFIERLGNYVIERVSKISLNLQRPVKLIPDGYRDFVISVVE